MSLASLVLAYVINGEYATAQSNGDLVAQTRMRLELAEAVAAELPATMVDRLLTTAERNNCIRAYSVVFPQGPSIGTVTAIPTNHRLTPQLRLGIQRMINHADQVLATSLAQLKGEFPTAAGVTNPADAIYPGTRVYAVWDNTPWETSVAIVLADNGDDPIDVEIDGAPQTIDRDHIHFEFLPAEADRIISNLALYDYYTNATLQLPIIEINDAPTSTVKLDNGLPAGLVVPFADFIDGTWYPDTVAQAIIDGLAIGQDYTDGADTWPVDSINAFPTATVILDDGNPGMLTVPFASFVDGTWTLVP
jgi:hypothetical protein